MTTKERHAWLNNYPAEVAPSYPYSEKGLHEFLQAAAEEYPEKTAIHFKGKSLTYQALLDYSLQFANALKTLGLEKGDRVAIMLANTPQSVICYYGALFAGGVVVQMNPLFVEREIEQQLVDSDAKMLVCLDMVYPRVQKVRQNTGLEHVFVTGIKDFLPFPKNKIYPYIQKKDMGMKIEVTYDNGTHNWKEAVTNASKTFESPAIDPKKDLALIQYTGGTTGAPKGVMLTHYNLVVNTEQCIRWMYKTERGKERILAALPFFHVYGMTTAMNLGILNVAELVIVPKFDPKEILKTIEKKKITMFPGAPTMYIGLTNHPDIEKHDLSSIKACLSGAAPLPREVQLTFEEKTGGKLVEGYGLTETSPVASANPIWEMNKNGSIGLPWPDTEMAALDQESGDIAPINEVGEIAVRGPQVMQGYWKKEEETNAVFSGDWFKTGDMGYQDEDGFFYIVDRKKDMIIAGGFNIYPREVEEILYEHEAILEAAVVGVPHPYRGETVKAFVVLKEGQEATHEDLEAFCRSKLAAYKIPRIFEQREELPKTFVGKVLRRALVEEEMEKQEAIEAEKKHG
ncbi:long-chain-fatty-acid--CoA ligase [Salicibibacter cibarius]|uniref:Long-chain-fatty-acid--CoA ligase n=1 Tax=Salicibibacter cibarius TaxID=2743000 RepID=A0A7T6Z5G9_9BACI|nr:long-chain-fatty-acid--CoA ligase [Salicibibacter cibarius]QQK77167.1 long-chain-fatty-acid--CoA ligase [Salicibibacter cibarius]